MKANLNYQNLESVKSELGQTSALEINSDRVDHRIQYPSWPRDSRPQLFYQTSRRSTLLALILKSGAPWVAWPRHRSRDRPVHPEFIHDFRKWAMTMCHPLPFWPCRQFGYLLSYCLLYFTDRSKPSLNSPETSWRVYSLSSTHPYPQAGGRTGSIHVHHIRRIAIPTPIWQWISCIRTSPCIFNFKIPKTKNLPS